MSAANVALAELTAALAWEMDRLFEAIVSLSDCRAVESCSSACLTESWADAFVAAVGPAWSVASLALADSRFACAVASWTC